MRTLLPALALVTALLVACKPSATIPEGATFVLASSAGLTLLDERCHEIGKLVAQSNDTTPSSPTLAPGGTTVVFAMAQISPSTGFGSDIYAINLDGSGLRPLLEHERENVFYASPRLDPSGDLLFFHRRAAVIRDGSYVGNEDSIERLNLRTGERKRIVEQAADPDISRDGRHLVFVRLTDAQPDPSGPWIANLDGGDARRLLPETTFWYLQAPRFSPVGDDLVFSAANLQSTSAGAKLAHLGVPSDLMLTSLSAPTARSIAVTGDDVVPAWSADGTRIAYVGSGAMFLLTVADGSVTACAEGEDFFYGDLLWLP